MRKAPKQPRARRLPWLVACVVGAGLVGGILLKTSSSTSTPETAPLASPAPRTSAPGSGFPRQSQGQYQGGQPLPGTAAPVKEGSTRSSSPHYVPASRLQPPGADPHPVLPPTPQEPPDPVTHQPPMHNPGGVDGDRPPRAVPGIDSAAGSL
jgi:hypothetical protein